MDVLSDGVESRLTRVSTYAENLYHVLVQSVSLVAWIDDINKYQEVIKEEKREYFKGVQTKKHDK